MKNKKVFLRERKRHTDRSVSRTPSVVLYRGRGYPCRGEGGGSPSLWGGGYPTSGTPSDLAKGYPIPAEGTPSRVPPSDLAGGYPILGTPPAGPGRGTPPVDRQTDRYVSKHNLPVVLRTRSVKIKLLRL